MDVGMAMAEPRKADRDMELVEAPDVVMGATGEGGGGTALAAPGAMSPNRRSASPSRACSSTLPAAASTRPSGRYCAVDPALQRGRVDRRDRRLVAQHGLAQRLRRQRPRPGDDRR
jgi:hypothetical protein